MPVKPTTDMSGADETTAGTDTTPDSAEGDRISFIESSSLKSLSTHEVSPQSLREYTERVRARERHPELTPSLLLWIDFGEGSDMIPGVRRLGPGYFDLVLNYHKVNMVGCPCSNLCAPGLCNRRYLVWASPTVAVPLYGSIVLTF